MTERPVLLSTRDFATVLAGLRLRQEEGEGRDPNAVAPEIDDIASDGGEIAPLDADEIDALCERLNFVDDDRAAADALRWVAAWFARRGGAFDRVNEALLDTMADELTPWRIRSTTEVESPADGGGPLAWHSDDGWVGTGDGERFTQHERDGGATLPIGGRWEIA